MEDREPVKAKGKKGWRMRFYLAAGFIATALISGTGDGIVEASRKLVSESVIPAVTTAGYQIYGWFNPLPEHHDYHFAVTFYIPPAGGKVGGTEGTGVSIPGEACRKSGGTILSQPSALNFENWQNNVITEAYCSGRRVTVTLIPQTGGEKQIIYDGLFSDGKQISFSGVAGRYNAGVLKLLSTDRSQPVGEWVPVNACQRNGTC